MNNYSLSSHIIFLSKFTLGKHKLRLFGPFQQTEAKLTSASHGDPRKPDAILHPRCLWSPMPCYRLVFFDRPLQDDCSGIIFSCLCTVQKISYMQVLIWMICSRVGYSASFSSQQAVRVICSTKQWKLLRFAFKANV